MDSDVPDAADDYTSLAKAGAPEGPATGIAAPIAPFLPRDEAPVSRRPERRVAIAVDGVDLIYFRGCAIPTPNMLCSKNKRIVQPKSEGV